MKNRRRSSGLTIFFFCIVLPIAVLAAARARGESIADLFTRVGSGESLIAPFTIPSTSTVNSYGGAVEVIVSGTGFSYGALVNDAFYGVPSGIPVDYYGVGSPFAVPFYQLNIGWSNGFPLVGCEGEPNNANNYITFIEGVGPVTPPAMPAYDAVNHTYHFVVSIPADAGILSFGVSDCIFYDNGGAYDIQVFQLMPISPGLPTHTRPPTPTATPTATPGPPTSTPAPLTCVAAPRTGCQPPQWAAGISLNAAARIVRWKWAGGSTPVALSQFGDPVGGSTAYALCVYDTSAGPPFLAFSATVPSGGTCGTHPCWKRSHHRFSYTNPASTPDGLTRITLQPKSGHTGAAIVVSGRGPNLRMPVSADGVVLLREFPEVIVQLQRGDSPGCWESVFTSPPAHNRRWVFADTMH